MSCPYELDVKIRKFVNNDRVRFIETLQTDIFVEGFPDLLQSKREEIRLQLTNIGRWRANSLLLDEILRVPGFPQKFVKFCKEKQECIDLAKLIKCELEKIKRRANSRRCNAELPVGRNQTSSSMAQSPIVQGQRMESSNPASKYENNKVMSGRQNTTESSSFFLSESMLEDALSESRGQAQDSNLNIDSLKDQARNLSGGQGTFPSEDLEAVQGAMACRLNIPQGEMNNLNRSPVMCQEDMTRFREREKISHAAEVDTVSFNKDVAIDCEKIMKRQGLGKPKGQVNNLSPLTESQETGAKPKSFGSILRETYGKNAKKNEKITVSEDEETTYVKQPVMVRDMDETFVKQTYQASESSSNVTPSITKDTSYLRSSNSPVKKQNKSDNGALKSVDFNCTKEKLSTPIQETCPPKPPQVAFNSLGLVPGASTPFPEHHTLGCKREQDKGTFVSHKSRKAVGNTQITLNSDAVFNSPDVDSLNEVTLPANTQLTLKSNAMFNPLCVETLNEAPLLTEPADESEMNSFVILNTNEFSESNNELLESVSDIDSTTQTPVNRNEDAPDAAGGIMQSINTYFEWNIFTLVYERFQALFQNWY